MEATTRTHLPDVHSWTPGKSEQDQVEERHTAYCSCGWDGRSHTSKSGASADAREHARKVA